jgi:tRNA N6-adenosine threonylcarbamoyltransferase
MEREATPKNGCYSLECSLRHAHFLIIMMPMIVLGIETSCDETSAAIMRDGRLISNIAKTQLAHSRYGGVVPEIASRAHQQLIIPVVEEALRVASVKRNELSAVAATYGPGLIGSLLVGLSFGKALALGTGIPFVGVNHMEAHLLSNLLDDPAPEFPFVNLTVSGGHTQLVLVRAPFRYTVLGETRDDAAGEAFDKAAKMLGIEYPGGPVIDSMARNGNPGAVNFPRPYLEEGSLDFSFSGLKTSLLYYLRKNSITPEALRTNKSQLADLCASFQAAIVDVLLHKLFLAATKHGTKDICVSGGVAANSELRRRLAAEASARGLRLHIPRFEYCTDNGAMIAEVGYLKIKEGTSSNLELAAEPNLQLQQQS